MHSLDDLGLFRGEIMLLPGIGLHVIELQRRDLATLERGLGAEELYF